MNNQLNDLKLKKAKQQQSKKFNANSGHHEDRPSRGW